MPLETPAGKVVHVEFISNVYAEGDGDIIQCNIRDVSERYEAKRKLEHYYQTLRTINKCNTSLVRSTTESAVSDGVCKALVIEGRYAAAWVGLLDSDNSLVVPVSSAGLALSQIPRSITYSELAKEDAISQAISMRHQC